MDDLIIRQATLNSVDTWDKFGCAPDGKLVRYDDNNHYVPYVHYEDMVHAIKHLPPAQQIPWDKKTRKSMVGTLQMLRRVAYNINGVMDVIDDDNVNRLIAWLEGGQDDT